MRKTIWILALAAVCAFTLWSISRPAEVPFEKVMIDSGASETAAFADINGDGKLDIVSGEYWYEAPKWTPHKFRDVAYVPGYVDVFADLPLDVNGDGKVDIVSAHGFQNKLVWMENPGKTGAPWKEHVIDQGYFIEFAFLVDLTNSGKKDCILPQYGGANAPTAWYEHKDGGFVKHVVSPKTFGHGIGAGDVNGDGRIDIITPEGWFRPRPTRAPASGSGTPTSSSARRASSTCWTSTATGGPTSSPPWPTTMASSGSSRPPTASGSST